MQTKYKYFKFNEGRYFRLDESKYTFQILNDDNLWQDSDNAERLYDDAATKYEEITDIETIKKLENIKTINESTNKVTISDYETRTPNSNSNYFNSLSEPEKAKYLDLYLLYYDLLYKYLISKLELQKYDDMLLNSQNIFYQVAIENMDLYQKIGSKYLKYFYLRNNLYIERLSKEELDFLNKKLVNNNHDLDNETLTFINNTYQKVILENYQGEVYNINYGPDSLSFYKPNNALIIGVRFDNYYKSPLESDDEWNNKYNDRLYELEIIMKILSRKLEKFETLGYVIEYNDFSIKNLNSNEEKTINGGYYE